MFLKKMICMVAIVRSNSELEIQETLTQDELFQVKLIDATDNDQSNGRVCDDFEGD